MKIPAPIDKHALASHLMAAEALQTSIVLRFEEIAEAFPENIAVQDSRDSITFRELNGRANQLARALLKADEIPDEAPVAFMLGHESSAVVAIIGILKAGHPYVALSPSSPPHLSAWRLADSTCAAVVTDRVHAAATAEAVGSLAIPTLDLDDILAGPSAPSPHIYASDDSPFAIFYTSASTGASKGVVHTHGLVLNQMRYRLDAFGVSASDRVALMVSLGFQHSSTMMMDGLLSGGSACLYDLSANGPQRALRWLLDGRITMLATSPTVWRAIFAEVPEAQMCPDLRTVMISGEFVAPADLALCAAHTTSDCACYVAYGSTEAALVALYRIPRGGALPAENPPIGFAAAGYEIVLLGADGQPVHVGQEGEIVIRGNFHSSGYWRRPDLTARRFKAVDGAPQVKIFHSGDLGLMRPDGSIEFRGRQDTQVKIRGNRIDEAEVQAVLAQDPDVQDAVVTARPAKNRLDQLQLVAYVVVKPGKTTTASRLRQFASTRLPGYAVPAFFVLLDQLPLNPNGKVDRRALPEPPERAELTAEELPGDPLESELVKIWSGVLKTTRVGVRDNFFELGGDSLLFLSMTLEVEQELSKAVPQAFFEQPTVRHLAEMLRGGELPRAKEAGQPSVRWRTQVDPATHGPRTRWGLVRRLSRRLRALRDPAGAFQWALARRMRTMSYDQIRDLVFRIAARTSIRTIFFRKQELEFVRFVSSLGLVPEDRNDALRASLVNNVLFNVVEARPPFGEAALRDGPGASSLLQWGTERRRLIEEAPAEELDQRFPIEGIQYLQEAMRKRRGVVLLSIHGTAGANRVALRILARRCGLPPIETISQTAALRDFTENAATWDRLPAAVAASLSAEVALQGQGLLRQGAVIHIAGDGGRRGPGRTYSMRVGDRIYAIKAGFAQLALENDADVLPICGRFTQDGRMQLSILPPLQARGGSRDDQVASLIQQYEDFANSAMRRHPEMVVWARMAKHLRQPRASWT